MVFDHASSFDDAPASHDPDLMASSDPLTPERRLWLACIGQAWKDAFVSRDPTLTNSEGYGWSSPETRETLAHGVRWQARRWLTVSVDPWRGDRLEVCDYAGVDESLLRRAAVARLAVAKAEEEEAARREAQAEHKRDYNRQRMRRIRARERVDAAFEELLSRESGMAPADVDSALADLASLERIAA